MKINRTQFWEIYERLAKKKPFQLIGNSVRRNNRFGSFICPICAVANYLQHKNKYSIDASSAGKTLGLPQQFISDIVVDADGQNNKYRNKLLKLGRCK